MKNEVIYEKMYKTRKKHTIPPVGSEVAQKSPARCTQITLNIENLLKNALVGTYLVVGLTGGGAKVAVQTQKERQRTLRSAVLAEIETKQQKKIMATFSTPPR